MVKSKIFNKPRQNGILALFIFLNIGSKAQQHCDGWYENWTHKHEIDGYVTVFSDDFNAESLNLDFWDYGMPWGPFVNEDAPDGFAPENAYLENGALVIVTEKKANNFLSWDHPNGQWISTPKDFTSGAIHSKRTFKLGRFEISYKFDLITKQWPAFWLYGDCAQEIDIFEFWTMPWLHRYNTHLKKGGDCSANKKCSDPFTTNRDLSTFYDGRWHNSAVDWGLSTLDFSYNNNSEYKLYRHFSTSGAHLENPPSGSYLRNNLFPFQTYGMSVIVSQGVKDISLVGERKFYIDRITIKKPIDCSSYLLLDDNITNEITFDGYVTAGDIEINSTMSNLTLSNFDFLHLYASSQINIYPSFDTWGNDEFSLNITPCPTVYNKKAGSENNPEFLTESLSQQPLIEKIVIFNMAGQMVKVYDNISCSKSDAMKVFFEKKPLNLNSGFYIMKGLSRDRVLLTEKICITK
jgi:hypothetical protein